MERLSLMCSRCRACYFYLSISHRSYSVSSILHKSSSLYDVLNVPRTASMKEIKEAYFTLSKELHPDRNPSNPEQHQKFVELNEAYNILSKPISRSQYDDDRFKRYTQGYNRSSATYNQSYSNRYDWYEEVDYSKFSEQMGNSKGYYGIKGIGRLSNRVILHCVLIYLLAGAILHYFIYQQSSEYAQKRLNEKDRKIAGIYNAAKEKAMKNGNMKQMQIMRKTHEEKHLQYFKEDD